MTIIIVEVEEREKIRNLNGYVCSGAFRKEELKNLSVYERLGYAVFGRLGDVYQAHLMPYPANEYRNKSFLINGNTYNESD